jgi:hypothetical protein
LLGGVGALNGVKLAECFGEALQFAEATNVVKAKGVGGEVTTGFFVPQLGQVSAS